MKNIKTFESWSNVPAGSESDPRAPWNQKDPEFIRGIDLKSTDLKFDIIHSDYSEVALLKKKDDGKIYALYFDPTDENFRDYMQVDREYIGKDEDGFPEYEYDWDDVEVDDKAIISYASEDAKYNGLGKGLSDYEEGKVTLINSEIAEEIINMYQFAPQLKIFNDIIDFLKPFTEAENN